MWKLPHRQLSPIHEYALVSASDDPAHQDPSLEDLENKKQDDERRQRRRNGTSVVLVLCIGFILVTALILVRVFLDEAPKLVEEVEEVIEGEEAAAISTAAEAEGSSTLFKEVCPDPPVRKEWRTLSEREQGEYIEAVKCLKTKPSRLGEKQTLYDDFPFVHMFSGDVSHDSALFLPWHRYFIHAYESALRTSCSYNSTVPYWDWTLDSADFTSAPVFLASSSSSSSPSNHNSLTFGGTGNISISTPNPLLEPAHCVTSGAFPNLEVPYVGRYYEPHCLTRAFLTGDELKEQEKKITPEAVEQVMQAESYESFFASLEDGPHAAIPATLQGDFALFTAPSDPIFFLHHAQLDRLWWQWQRKDNGKRKWNYGGWSSMSSGVNASLEDVIVMGGLLANVTVGEVMDTEAEVLCYRY